MIHDLDRALRELLKRELPQSLAQPVAISFDSPDDQFPPQAVTLPAIDLFLYDVRENHDLRSKDRTANREILGAAERFLPPVRIDCSYLITAWPGESAPNRAEDEHRLLGEVMIALLRYPKLPLEVLKGGLASQELPLPTAVLQSGHLQNLGEFWQALGGKPKAALHYTVTIAVQPFETVQVPMAVVADAELGPTGPEGARYVHAPGYEGGLRD